MSGWLHAAACWIATLAIHSTLLGTAALAFSRLLGGRALALQETVLRTALLAAFATAALHGRGLGSAASIGWSVPAATAAAHDRTPWLAALPAAVDGNAAAAARRPVPATPDVAAASALAPWIVGAACGMAAGGLALLLLTACRLRRLLRRRRPLGNARVLAIAAAAARDLGLSRAPQLSCLDSLPSPIAFGLLRLGICLPERASRLDDEELRALLLHELAHVRRGDPRWLWLGAVVQALLPWQVLWLPLRRRLHAIAELRCDAAAARQSHPLTVAQCLLHVASWYDATRATDPGARLSHAMAAQPSALRQRVEAVLHGAAEGRLPGGTALLVVLGMLLLGARAAPGMRPVPIALPAMAPGTAGAASATTPVAEPWQELELVLSQRAQLRAEAEVVLRRARASRPDEETRRLLDLLEARAAAMAVRSMRLQALLRTRSDRGQDPARSAR